MLIQSWAEAIQSAFQDVWTNFIIFVPSIVAAVVIFVIGWVVGSVVGRVVGQLIEALKVDSALKSAGVDDIAARAGFTINSAHIVSSLIKWFIILVFLVASLQVLGLTQVNVFLEEVVLLYVPQVIVAVLILLLATVVGEVVRRVVAGATRAANARGANFLGGIAKWAIWIFAFLAALAQLGVATAFVQMLFAGVVVALALAFGLAFGLGGKDEAARFLAKTREEMSNKE